ncbi:hypothetical protein ABW19_dt0200360 [Dactylella cylindrospora]|nr:hypothetical protein ABW19_dt0200360 [Dactylella cylindrospora]
MISIRNERQTRPRSNSMPAIHLNTHFPPLIKQYPRRRSVFQTNPFQNVLSYLSRERFQPVGIREKFRYPRGERYRGAAGGARPSLTRRGPFRRKVGVERPIVHQTELATPRKDEISCEESSEGSSDSCSTCSCSCCNECESDCGTAVGTDHEEPSTTNSDDSNENSKVKVSPKPPGESSKDWPSLPNLTLPKTSEEPSIPIVIPKTNPPPPSNNPQTPSHPRPLSLPLHPDPYHIHQYDYPTLPPFNRPDLPIPLFNHLSQTTHCPRLTGQCCRCGSRGRCRHLHPSWIFPENLLSSLIRHSAGGFTGSGSIYSSSSFGPGGREYALIHGYPEYEAYIQCPCGRGCRCECISKVLLQGRERERTVRERRRVEVHNTNTHTTNANFPSRGGGCYRCQTCPHSTRGHHGRNCIDCTREYCPDECYRCTRGDGYCEDCGHWRCGGGGRRDEECVEIRRNGERLQICQRRDGRLRGRRGYGRDMEVSCVIF